MKEILYQFKKANFKKEASNKAVGKNKTADFDENFQFINDVVFAENHLDFD